MALKFIITKLEDVPENLRPMYVQQGDRFVLDVDGVVAKEKLDEFRNNNIELQKKIDSYKDVDPVKYRELMAIQQKITEKELLDKGEVEKLVELRVTTMREDLTTQLNTSKTALEKAQAQLGVLLIDNVIKSAAIKQGVIPEAVDDVVLRAKSVYSIDDKTGAPVPKGSDGKVIYGKDGTSPMSVDEWLTSLKTSAKHLFQGSRGSGAGGGDNVGGKGDLSKMTPAQKISIGLAANAGATQLPS